jgi:hypothetical protein
MSKSYTEATKGLTDETFFNKVFSGEIRAFEHYNDPINPILEKLKSHRDAFQEQLTDDTTFIKNKNEDVERDYWQHRKKAIEAAIEKMDEIINEPSKRIWEQLKPVLEEANQSNILTDGKDLCQIVSDSNLFRKMKPNKFFRASLKLLKKYRFDDLSELKEEHNNSGAEHEDPSKQKEPPEQLEKTSIIEVKDITISILSEEAVTIQLPRKKKRDVSHSSLGFDRSDTKEWKNFLSILEKGFFEVGKSKTRELIDKGYARNQTLLKTVEKKLQGYFNTEQKMFQRVKGKSGYYEPIFQRQKQVNISTIRKMTKEKLFEYILDLVKSFKISNEEEVKIEICKASEEAKRKGATKLEIESIISSDDFKDDIKSMFGEYEETSRKAYSKDSEYNGD